MFLNSEESFQPHTFAITDHSVAILPAPNKPVMLSTHSELCQHLHTLFAMDQFTQIDSSNNTKEPPLRQIVHYIS